MRKRLLQVFSSLLLAFVLFGIQTGEAFALVCPAQISPSDHVTKEDTITISYDLGTGQPCSGSTTGEACFDVWGCNEGWGGTGGCAAHSNFPLSSIGVSMRREGNRVLYTFKRDAHLRFWLEEYENWNTGSQRKVTDRACGEQVINVSSVGSTCEAGMFKVVKYQTDQTNYTYRDTLGLKVDRSKAKGFVGTGTYMIFVEGVSDPAFPARPLGAGIANLGGSGTTEFRIGQLAIGTYRTVLTGRLVDSARYCDGFTFTVTEDGNNEQGGDDDDETDGDAEVLFELCNQAWNRGIYPNRKDDPNFQKCAECFDSKKGIWTAIGCINYDDPVETIRSFIVLGLGIGGGVVVLMTLAGAFLLSTSQGDPKRVDEAKSLISSAIIGLLFVIFSITILRFIGVRVLRIPGFGG